MSNVVALLAVFLTGVTTGIIANALYNRLDYPTQERVKEITVTAGMIIVILGMIAGLIVVVFMGSAYGGGS